VARTDPGLKHSGNYKYGWRSQERAPYRPIHYLPEHGDSRWARFHVERSGVQREVGLLGIIRLEAGQRCDRSVCGRTRRLRLATIDTSVWATWPC